MKRIASVSAVVSALGFALLSPARSAPIAQGSPVPVSPGKLGFVSGAHLDPDSGRIFLLGDGDPAAPEVTPELLATSLNWVFPETQRMPYVSIDPIPENPTGPHMLIDLDPASKDTEFGWILFEADRLLKCLALGVDNVFAVPETSNVPGHRDLFEIAEALPDTKDSGSAVWSRFWFHPLSNRVRWDDSTLRIEECRLGVRTEVMVLEKGRLVSTQGRQDPAAKAFADHFTERYRDYGTEFPVFLSLEQLGRMLLVSAWLRQIRDEVRPVSVAWTRSAGGPRFEMPRYTPSLRASRETQSTRGDVTEIVRHEIFGGVDLSVTPNRAPTDASFESWKKTVPEIARNTESGPFPWEGGMAAKIPASPVFAGTATKTPLMHLRVEGRDLGLETRDFPYARDPLGEGSAREFALPSLPSYRPRGHEGRIGEFAVEGRPQSRMEDRHFELNGPDGGRIGVFDTYRVEPLSGEIHIGDSKNTSPGWFLTPERDQPGVIWAVEGNQRRWAFDAPSGSVVAEFRGDQLYHYRYNRRGRLERVETRGEEGESAVVTLTRDREDGPVAAVTTADGQRVSMRSEARNSRPNTPLDFEVFNEVGESRSLHYDPAKRRFSLPEGILLSEKGFHPVEAAADRILPHLPSGERDLRIHDLGGYSILQNGLKGRLVPTRKTEFERNAAKASGLSEAELRKSEFATLFAAEDPTEMRFIVDDSPSFRNHLGTISSKLWPQQLHISTRNRERAVQNLRRMETLSDQAPGKVKVELLAGTLEGQEAAIAELRRAASVEPGVATDPSPSPVSVVVAHSREGTAEQVHEVCGRSGGGFVLGLFCNTSRTATESQRIADQMVEAGAGAAVVPQGLLDAKDAARVLDKIKESPLERGQNPLEWIRSILQDLGLERSFGTPTSMRGEPEGDGAIPG